MTVKSQRVSNLLGAFLLAGALANGFQASAEHIQLFAQGVVQTVNFSAKSFTLVLDKENTTNTFFWDSNTWFREKSPQPNEGWFSRWFSSGTKTNAAALRPSLRARMYYHEDYGRFNTREIVVLRPVPNPSTPAGR